MIMLSLSGLVRQPFVPYVLGSTLLQGMNEIGKCSQMDAAC